METFADAAGLRVYGLGFCMLNFVQGQIELIVVRLRLVAGLGATVCQDVRAAFVRRTPQACYPTRKVSCCLHICQKDRPWLGNAVCLPFLRPRGAPLAAVA